MTATSVRNALLLVAVPALAWAQENAGPTPAPTESKLWWMWIAVALLLLGGLLAIFLTPRRRAADRERGRRIVHGHAEPRPSER